MKINHNSAIIFDLDDTLYKEIDYLKSAYKKISEIVKTSNSNSLYIKMQLKYNNNEDVLGFISKKYKISVEELLEIYRYHIPNIEIDKDSRDILKIIKKKKHKNSNYFWW